MTIGELVRSFPIHTSVFEYERSTSFLVGQQLLVTSPKARNTVFVSFVW